jgi:hypothetical protein
MGKITWIAYMWTWGGLPTRDTAMRYKGLDEAGRLVGFITNIRSRGRVACWRISRRSGDPVFRKTIQGYAAAEEAMAAF